MAKGQPLIFLQLTGLSVSRNPCLFAQCWELLMMASNMLSAVNSVLAWIYKCIGKLIECWKGECKGERRIRKLKGKSWKLIIRTRNTINMFLIFYLKHSSLALSVRSGRREAITQVQSLHQPPPIPPPFRLRSIPFPTFLMPFSFCLMKKAW